MIRSFRLRLALAVALLAGLTLAAFAGSAYWLIRNAKVERIDSSLRLHAEREAQRLNRQGVRPAVEALIASALGISDRHDFAIMLIEDGDTPGYQSPSWPSGASVGQLPWQRIGQLTGESTSRWSPISSAYAAPEDWRRPPPPRRFEDFPPPHPRDFPPPRPEPLPDDTVASPPAPTPAGSGTESVSPPTQPATAPTELPRRPPPPPRSIVLGHQDAAGDWRIALASSESARVALAVNLHAIEGEMHGVRNAFLLALPFAIALIGIGAWLLSGRALRPVQKLTEAAGAVTVNRLQQRINDEGEDREFAELIAVFNRMLGRLQRSFAQAQRFSADAAHELKTPLAILQGQLERAIQQAESGSAQQAQLADILQEVQRLATISRKLLLLSQADSGSLRVHTEALALGPLLTTMIEDIPLLAPTLQVHSRIDGPLWVAADAALIQQVLHNLLSNAIKYNLPEGWIRIDAGSDGPQVEVIIANAARPMRPADRERIFERFFRADTAHGREIDGVGLGLALSREIVHAHQGTLSFAADDEGRVRVSLRLPAAPAPSRQD